MKLENLHLQEQEQEQEQAPLPEGYHFEEGASIHPLEIARLMQQVEMGVEIPDDYVTNERALELSSRGLDILDIGVRAADGQLAGIGSVVYKGDVGELCGFVVSPDHQSRGVGKAIITERLAMAERAGLASLYINGLEPTNTLRTFYLENGFTEEPDGSMVRGPYPVSLSAIKPVLPVAYEHSS
jgi:GNAT superfamily N-acetyltransferase